MGAEEVVGIEELPRYEDDGGDCQDNTWVETQGSSNATKKMCNVERGIEIRMGKEITYVTLIGVRIWEI